jgi:hypothetical protein
MTRRREQGSALVVTLGVIVCLTGLGLGMLTTAMTERTIAARMRAASASAVAAGAAVEFACAEFGGVADWSLALDGRRGSALQDAVLRPVTPSRTVIDLDVARVALQADTNTTYPVGADAPQWRLWAWGPLSRLASVGADVTRDYVAVWVADDPGDGDDRPAIDANGVIMVHGEAYGDGATRRSVDAVIARAAGAVRVLSWRAS